MKPPASSPCLADEFDPAHVELEQAHDVAVWRKATRLRLLPSAPRWRSTCGMMLLMP